jgi:hypothetical protein
MFTVLLAIIIAVTYNVIRIRNNLQWQISYKKMKFLYFGLSAALNIFLPHVIVIAKFLNEWSYQVQGAKPRSLGQLLVTDHSAPSEDSSPPHWKGKGPSEGKSKVLVKTISNLASNNERVKLTLGEIMSADQLLDNPTFDNLSNSQIQDIILKTQNLMEAISQRNTAKRKMLENEEAVEIPLTEMALLQGFNVLQSMLDFLPPADKDEAWRKLNILIEKREISLSTLASPPTQQLPSKSGPSRSVKSIHMHKGNLNTPSDSSKTHTTQTETEMSQALRQSEDVKIVSTEFLSNPIRPAVASAMSLDNSPV